MHKLYLKGVMKLMRKKSHLALASYLMNSEGMGQLATHKKAFYIGNILPDCIPSFITKRHTIEETFSILKRELTLLIEHYDFTKGITSYFCRHLGIILHHVADYFTFPHNSFYQGTLREHCKYEELLKHRLRSYVKSEDAQKKRDQVSHICSVEDICNMVRDMHEHYRTSKHSLDNDCNFIITICHKIVDSLLHLFSNATNQVSSNATNQVSLRLTQCY